MIYLHQYPGIWQLPSLSPFCVKVETYLRMVKLPYQVVIENNPAKGPKGKMPVLRDEDKTIADSSFILEYLQQHYGISLDDSLSTSQNALSHVIQKMIEENLYFVILYSRWIDPVGKNIIDKAFRPFFPKWLSKMALAWIRRNLKKQAYYQGMGRHTQEEIYHFGCKDITALSDLLGAHLFILEDNYHIIDATVYAFLITILNHPVMNPLKSHLLQQQNLIEYCDRMTNTFYCSQPTNPH